MLFSIFLYFSCSQLIDFQTLIRFSITSLGKIITFLGVTITNLGIGITDLGKNITFLGKIITFIGLYSKTIFLPCPPF
jgi:hypothetical protein